MIREDATAVTILVGVAVSREIGRRRDATVRLKEIRRSGMGASWSEVYSSRERPRVCSTRSTAPVAAT